MGLFDFLFKKDEDVDKDLQKQLKSRGITEVSPEAVKNKLEETQEEKVEPQKFNFDLFKPAPVAPTKTTTPFIVDNVVNKEEEKRDRVKSINFSDQMISSFTPVLTPIAIALPDFSDDVTKLVKRTVTDSIGLAVDAGKAYSSMWADGIKSVGSYLEKRKTLDKKPEQGEVVKRLTSDTVNSTPKGLIRDITNEEFEYQRAADLVDKRIDETWNDIIKETNKRVPGVASVWDNLRKDVAEEKTKEYYKNRKEWEEADWTEKFTKYLPETLYNYAPSLLSTYGFYTISPATGATVIAGSTAQDIRDTAEAEGKDPSESNGLALLTGMAVAASEGIAQGRIRTPKSGEIAEIIGKIGKKNISKFISDTYKKIYAEVSSLLKTGLTGSATETTQEIITIAAESTLRDIGYDEIESRGATSALLGFFGDSFFDVAGRYVNSVKSGEANNLKVGLSVEDISQINRKLNESNPADFKRDVFEGKREKDRAVGETFDRLQNAGVFAESDTPNTIKTVYRASTDGPIKMGDFVTTKPEIAQSYVEKREGSNIVTEQVVIEDLINSMGINGEFVYAPINQVNVLEKVSRLSEEDRGIFESLISEEVKNKLDNKEALTINEEAEVADLFSEFQDAGLVEREEMAIDKLTKDLERVAENLPSGFNSAEEFIKAKGLDPDSVSIIDNDNFIVESAAFNKALLTELPIESFGKPKFETLNQDKYEAGQKIIDPIEVTLVDGKLQITDGANRFTQAVANGDKTIPVVLENSDGSVPTQSQIKSLSKKKKTTEQKNYLKDLKNDIAKTIERSKFVSPKEQKKLALIFEKSIVDGTLDPKKVLKKESVLLRDSLRLQAKAARQAGVFTKKEIKKYQKEAKKLVDDSSVDALGTNNRKWIQSKIININENNFSDTLKQIEDRLSTVINKDSNLKASKEIDKLLKANKSKNIAGKKPEGKFPQDVQLAIDTLYRANQMWKNEKSLSSIENLFKNNTIDIAAGAVNSDSLAFQNTYLQMFLNAPNRQALLREVRALIEDGTVRKKLKEGNEQEEHDSEVNLLEKTIYGGKERPSATKHSLKMLKEKVLQKISNIETVLLQNYNTKLTTLNQANSPESDKTNPFLKYKLFREQTRRREMSKEFQGELKNTITDNYDNGKKEKNKTKEFVRRFNVYKNALKNLKKEIDLGTFTDAFGESTGKMKLEKDVIIQIWMDLQNKVEGGNRDILINGNGFTQEMETAVEEALTQEDKNFAVKQFGLYQKYGQIQRQDVKDQYGGDTGNLGYTFSPAKIENYKVDQEEKFSEAVKQAILRGTMLPSSARSRTKGENKKMGFRKSTSNLNTYVEQTIKNHTHWKQYAKIKKIFSDQKIRGAIKFMYGNRFLESLDKDLNFFATEKREGVVIPLIDNLRSNVVIATIAAKPKIFEKQLTSVLAYLEKMSTKEFVSGVADFLKHPVKNKKEMEDLQAFFRLRGVDIDVSLREALNNDGGRKFWRPLLKNWLSINVKLGDKGPIILGGWTLYKKRLAELTKKEPNRDINELKSKAMEYAADFSNETQQSSDAQIQSEIQRGGTFPRLLTPYTSASFAYQRKVNYAVKSLLRKDGLTKNNVAQAAKTIFIYHVMLNVIFQAVADFPEEDPKRLARAALFGNINNVMLGFDAFESLMNILSGEYEFGDTGIIESKVNLLLSAIKKLKVDDITLEDYLEAAVLLFRGGGELSGYPTTYAWNFAKGFQRIKTGDTKSAFKFFNGDSEWVVDKNNALVKLMNNSSKEIVDLDKAKKIVKEARDSGQITPEYANEVWDSFRTKQFSLLMEKELKKINTLKSLSAQDNYYQSLNEEEQNEVNRINSALFSKKKREIKLERDNKRITPEQAEAQWNRYNDSRWYPGKE
jgi:hypothetical protein